MFHQQPFTPLTKMGELRSQQGIDALKRGEAYRAFVLHHGVSESVVALCLELQVVGALEDQGLLQVVGLGVLVGHRVLAVVGDGLGRLLRQQADEGHLDRDGVDRLVFVAIGELDGEKRGCLERRLEKSVENLHREAVDVYFMHLAQ